MYVLWLFNLQINLRIKIRNPAQSSYREYFFFYGVFYREPAKMRGFPYLTVKISLVRIWKAALFSVE